MSGLPILDLIAGMIFIYFLLSIINNAMFELIAAILRLRAYYLKQWLERTFTSKFTESSNYSGKELSTVLMDHPLLNGLSKTKKPTTYFAAKEFASALIDLIAEDQKVVIANMKDMIALLESTTLLPKPLQRVFLMYAQQTNCAVVAAENKISELEHFSKQMEDWFDHTMARVGSTYKRKALLFTFFFSILITVSFNIDSVSLMKYLYNNPKARQELAASAYKALKDSTYINLVEDIKKKSKTLADSANFSGMVADSLNFSVKNLIADVDKHKALTDTVYSTLSGLIPIGWTKEEINQYAIAHPKMKRTELKRNYYCSKIPGFIITVLALCLGAPFWFDVLGKIANIRSSIKPQTSAEEEAKKNKST